MGGNGNRGPCREKGNRDQSAVRLARAPGSIGLKQQAFSFNDFFNFFLSVPGLHIVF